MLLVSRSLLVLVVTEVSSLLNLSMVQSPLVLSGKLFGAEIKVRRTPDRP